MVDIKFGTCREIYACVGMIASEVQSHLKRQRGTVAIILNGSTSFNLCDLAIIDTVSTFIALKQHFNNQITAIVCDSAPQLCSLQHLTPFDYEGSLFADFKLIEPPRSISLQTKHHVVIERNTADLVAEAVRDIISVSVLQEFNTITARMNSHARNQLRAKLVALIHGQCSVSDITNFILSLGLDPENFAASLNSRAFTALKQATLYYLKGHSLEYVMNQFGVEDSFEITYMAKLVKGSK